MPHFFNTTRSSISFTTRSGGVGVVPPKKWAVVPVSEAASADLVRLVQQGFLVRKEDAAEPVAAPAPKSSPKPSNIVAVPSPVTVAPLVTDAVTPASVEEDVASVPSVGESAESASTSRKKRKQSLPVIEEALELPAIEAAPTESVEAVEPVES